MLPKSWQVLAFGQLVKYKRAVPLGGGAQHSLGSPYDSAAMLVALPQGGKLDRRPRPPATEALSFELGLRDIRIQPKALKTERIGVAPLMAGQMPAVVVSL